MTHNQLDDREEKFVGLVRMALETVASVIAKRLGHKGVVSAVEPLPVASVDDLGSTRSEWIQQVNDSLLPYVSDTYFESGLAVAVGVRDALPANSDFVVPPIRDEIAEAYLANRRNFLVGISNDLWTEMREGLLDGFKEGESIEQLRNRVRESAGFAMGRAEAVARTEVVGASNAGAIDQVRATGLQSTKEWLATEDARTRLTHRHVLGQEGQEAIPLDAKFMVGGWAMDRPHDPNGPPEEVVQCRCTLIFDVDVAVLKPIEPVPELQAPELGQDLDVVFKRHFMSGLSTRSLHKAAPEVRQDIAKQLGRDLRSKLSDRRMREFLDDMEPNVAPSKRWWNDPDATLFRCSASGKVISAVAAPEKGCVKGVWERQTHDEAVSERIAWQLKDHWDGPAEADSWRWAMQQAIKDEFELDRSVIRLPVEMVSWDQAAFDRIVANEMDVLRTFVRIMHDRTQADLAEAGIDQVKLFRGFQFPNGRVPAALDRPEGEIISDLEFQPGSSFAWDPDVVHQGGFASYMVSTVVPRKRILATARTGFGTMEETEVVVLDTRGEVRLIFNQQARQRQRLGIPDPPRIVASVYIGPGDGITAAADNEATGAMIALIPSDADLDRLTLPDSIEGAEDRGVLHLTLWFLGKAADYDTEMRTELINYAESRVGEIGIIHGRGFGINFWNPDGDSPSWNLAVGDVEDGMSLSDVRGELSPRRVVSPDENPMPDQHSPWVPHICLAYSSDPGLAGELVDRVGDLTFDKVRIVFAGDETDIPLRGA